MESVNEINNSKINNNEISKNINHKKVKKSKKINYLSSIHKGILFFLLIISGNYIGNLLSCRIQDFFDTQIFAKHIIAFVSLYFFIILVEPELQILNPIKSLIFTIPIYMYFLVLSKTESSIFLIVLLSLFTLTLTHLYHNYLLNKINEESEEYENTSKNQKINISNLENMFLKNVDLIKQLILAFILIITIFGFIIYIGMKKTEYKDNFNFIQFLFGKVECKKNFLGSIPSLTKSKLSIAKHTLNLELIKIFFLRAFRK